MQSHEWDAIVIGGGVAGLSAAQMLGRARRRTLVIDGGEPRNRYAAHMHGVLGHDGIEPGELLARGRDEVARYGVAVDTGTVAGVRETLGGLEVVRADGRCDRTRAVIVTTGVRDDLPGIAGLRDAWGVGVLHCPYCHGWEVAGQALGVLATSPASLHQIELVRQWSDRVTAFTALAGDIPPEVRERLEARGIVVVADPVTDVVTVEGGIRAVRTGDGEEHPLDALFTAPAPSLDLGFLDGLDLAITADGALDVDPRGATSHPRVWAAGNVTTPYGNVPLSMGAGSMAGAGANAALVAEDAEIAVAALRRNRRWEERYAEAEAFWSGRVNRTFVDVAAALPAGSALEVGAGEGADAVWLAEQGWAVTAVDVSPTAIERATAAARSRGLSAEQVTFAVADAAVGLPDRAFDLVTTSFLHSWEADFPRLAILRAAADRVAPGGHLLVISHAAPPPWARELPPEAPAMHAPAEELAMLGLDEHEWAPLIVEVRPRATRDPDGAPASIDDGVLLLRRRPNPGRRPRSG